MGTVERAVEIDFLERQPLAASSGGGEGDEEETVLCSASFEDMEDSFLRYQTALWVLYSLLLILAWGIGLLMLLYAPIRRYVLRREFRSRKLYLTPDAIVYKVRSGALSYSFFSSYHLPMNPPTRPTKRPNSDAVLGSGRCPLISSGSRCRRFLLLNGREAVDPAAELVKFDELRRLNACSPADSRRFSSYKELISDSAGHEACGFSLLWGS